MRRRRSRRSSCARSTSASARHRPLDAGWCRAPNVVNDRAFAGMNLSSDLRHLVPGTAVVFVHGLWLTGVESLYLRKRIAADRGFHCASFTYRTTAGSMDGVVERLEKFVAGLDAERVHFVGHSLGG